MNTLIIPCAGRSTRFPNMRPKWMLTHPDGAIMLEKSMEGLNLEVFSRIVVVTTQPHVHDFNSDLIIRQAIGDNPLIEVCVLDNYTSSVVETIYKTIQKMNISGSFVIKDVDNYAEVIIPEKIENAVVGLDIGKIPDFKNPGGKSFLYINEQNIITNIVEKRIVSPYISVGIYCFEDTREFINGVKCIMSQNPAKELYISHIISYLIINKHIIFHYIPADDFADWGTINEWQALQKRYQAIFVDFDGVLIKNSGKYGPINWTNNNKIIEENLKCLLHLQDNNAQIIITTSRPEVYRKQITEILNQAGIYPHSIIMGLYHSPRVLINDFAPSNPYPSARAISIPRNTLLAPYLE